MALIMREEVFFRGFLQIILSYGCLYLHILLMFQNRRLSFKDQEYSINEEAIDKNLKFYRPIMQKA